MSEAASETAWRTNRRARIDHFPNSNNLAALMALLMADLSESQSETLMTFIFQRGVELTALAVDQLREFLITLIHAPKSSLENPSWRTSQDPDRSLPLHMANWMSMKATGSRTSSSARKAFLMSTKTPFGSTTNNAIGFDSRQVSEERRKAKGKGKQGKSKGRKGLASRRFLRPFKRGGGKGKKCGKTDSSSASKASIAEEVEEEAEEETLLADKKRKKKRPQSNKRHKAQPTTSTAHEAHEVDDEGFAYSAVLLPAPMAHTGEE